MGKLRSHSGSLLLELMLAILIFALAASVCVQAFVKAHQMSAQAQALSEGVQHASNAAEILRWAPDPDTAMAQLKGAYPQLEVEPPFAQAQIQGRTLEISWEEEAGLLAYTIRFREPSQEIYALKVLALQEVSP